MIDTTSLTGRCPYTVGKRPCRTRTTMPGPHGELHPGKPHRWPKEPGLRTIERWMNDGGCKAVDGCWTDPDGYCDHGTPSWALELGLI